MQPVRINIFGGPGVGKSTFAADLYSALSKRQNPVEQVNEWIKAWAWLDYKPQGIDQLYVLAKQMRKEDIVLRKGVSIVTDSPMDLQLAYIERDHPEFRPAAEATIEVLDQRYPCQLNVLLQRTVPYVTKGRYEDADQAIGMDRRIRSLVRRRHYYFLEVDPTSEDDLNKVVAHAEALMQPPPRPPARGFQCTYASFESHRESCESCLDFTRRYPRRRVA